MASTWRPRESCTASGHVATCVPPGNGFFARLGDGDDTGRLTTAVPGPSPSLIMGGDGDDRLEAGPGVLPGPSNSPVFNHGAGSDRIEGGPGSDLINGVEPADGPAASDRVACGEGDEGLIFGPYAPKHENHLGDEARIGVHDSVAADCEYLGQAMECPKDAGDLCEIDGVDVGPDWGKDRAAAATAARRGSANRLEFKADRVKAGETGVALAKLSRKRVKGLLGGRRSSTVRGVVRMTSGGRVLRTGKIRFRLRRR